MGRYSGFYTREKKYVIARSEATWQSPEIIGAPIWVSRHPGDCHGQRPRNDILFFRLLYSREYAIIF